MRPRTVIALAVVVAALAAFIAFYERDLPSSEERAELAKKVLGGLETDEVEALTLAWGEERVRLEKVGVQPAAGEVEGNDEETEPGTERETEPETRWRLTEPYEARADRQRVDDLLRGLADLTKKRTLEDASREEVGLEPPAATVTLTTAGGERVLEIGGEVPLSGDRVAALGGRPEVYVVGSSIFPDLTREPGDWRDRTLFPAQQDDIVRLEIEGPGHEPVVLARQGRQFRLEQPVADRADADKVRAFLAALVGLKVQSFVDDPEATPESLGLAPPWAVVAAEVQGGEGLRLEVGSAVDESAGRYHGRAGDQLFIFQVSDLAEKVGRGADAWRSLAWSGLEVFRIDSVTAEDGEGTLELSRSGSVWQRGGEEIPYAAASDLLYAITGTDAERLLGEGEAESRGLELGSPTLTLTLGGEGGLAETLSLYPEVADGVPARASDRDRILLLATERVERVRETLAAVRSAEPVSEDSGETPEGVEVEEEEGD